MSCKAALIGFTVLIWLAINASAVAQEAFLKKGTIALNPDDERTLFLYVPGFTLLYELGETSRSIRSRTFGNKEDYQFAITQDGIRVLVRAADIRTDVTTLKKYDFLVNRRMPLCETSEACRDIWSKFRTIGDEGDEWSALWARTAGKFTTSEESGVRAVHVSIGGAWQNGYIPNRKRNERRLEESGFITLLNRQYPTYSFEEKEDEELSIPCMQQRSQRSSVSLLKKVNSYAKAGGSAELSVGGSTGKSVLTNLRKEILSFLGLNAIVSAGAGVEYTGERGNIEETADEIVYGNIDEEWKVKSVNINRRSSDSSGAYLPFANVIIRKVLECRAGQPTEMTFASYFFLMSPEQDGQPPYYNVITLNTNEINKLNLPNTPLDGGLVSINTQTSHHNLLDFFLKYNIPKSVANFFIKEINVAEARR